MTCVLLRRVSRPLGDSIHRAYGRHRSSEHVPNTLPPPEIMKRRLPIWPRRKNSCPRHIAPRSDYTPWHKALVYSTLPEVGSMTDITMTDITGPSAPPDWGRFRIINHLLGQPPLTRLSPPHASGSLSAWRGTGGIATGGYWNARRPGTLRADFADSCAGWRKTESPSPLLPN